MRIGWIVAVALAPRLAAAEPAERLLVGDGLAAVAVAAPTTAVSTSLSTGWDEPRHGVNAVASAEAGLGHGVFVTGGAAYDGVNAWRPQVGLGVQVLRDAPVDLAVSAHYKAEGFTEPAGELELVAALGRRLGRAYALVDGVYGQDVDAHHRDAEVAAAVLAPAGRVIASASSRMRFGLGSTSELGGAWDLVADCGAAVPVSRYALRGAVGLSALKTTAVAVGPLASLTVSAFF